jgi:hypothetical protein
MPTIVRVTIRVAKVITKLACLVDVHVDYDSGKSKHFIGDKAVLMPRSKLPSVYLFATHHCDHSLVDVDNLGDTLAVVKTVLDPLCTLPRITQTYVSNTLQKCALWLWTPKTPATDTLWLRCVDLTTAFDGVIKENEDFAMIKQPVLRKAAFELLGRPPGEKSTLSKTQVAAAFGPNACIMRDAILRKQLKFEMTPENTLAVSTCKSTAEYFTFFTALPTISFHSLMTGSHSLRGLSYVILDRCAAYGERDMHALAAHLRRDTPDIDRLIVLNPTALLKGIVETYFRNCVCIDVPMSTFISLGSPQGAIKSSAIRAMKQKSSSAAYMKGDCAALGSGEIVEITRVAEMVSGFPVATQQVAGDDPVCRFAARASPYSIFQAAGSGYFVNGPVLMEVLDETFAKKMAAISLSGHIIPPST